MTPSACFYSVSFCLPKVCLWWAGPSSTRWWVQSGKMRMMLTDTPSSWPGWLSLSRSSVASFTLSWGRKNESSGLRDCCRTENTTQMTDCNLTAVSSRPEYLDPNVIKETDSSWRLNTAKTQGAWHKKKVSLAGEPIYINFIWLFFVNSNAMKVQWRPWLFKILLKEERYSKSIIIFCFVLCVFKYLVLKCHNKVYSQREFVDVDLKFSLVSKFQNNKTKNCVVLCLKFFGNGAMYLPLLNIL